MIWRSLYLAGSPRLSLYLGADCDEQEGEEEKDFELQTEAYMHILDAHL